MDLSVWDYSNIVSKWLVYIGVAAAVGGPFIAAVIKPASRIKAVLEYIVLGMTVGVAAVIANFLIQVGAFAEAGFGGMFDGELMLLLWQSPVGDALFWRLSGFGLLMLALMSATGNKLAPALKARLLSGLYLCALVALAYSFTFIGHNAELGGFARWLMALHILTIAWWIGALYPLWLSCRMLEQQALYRLMHDFGRYAVGMVAVLLVSGFSLLSLLLESPSELVTSPYGQAILLKLFVVAGILLLAAWHKFHLVPAVNYGKAQDVRYLQKSIGIEIWVAGVILASTAVLSTVMGPVNLV